MSFSLLRSRKKNCLFPLQVTKKQGSVGRDFFIFIFYFGNFDETDFSFKCKQRKYIHVISDIYKFILQFYTRFMLFSQDTMTCC